LRTRGSDCSISTMVTHFIIRTGKKDKNWTSVQNNHTWGLPHTVSARTVKMMNRCIQDGPTLFWFLTPGGKKKGSVVAVCETFAIQAFTSTDRPPVNWAPVGSNTLDTPIVHQFKWKFVMINFREIEVSYADLLSRTTWRIIRQNTVTRICHKDACTFLDENAAR
jgi:hypothetical protein